MDYRNSGEATHYGKGIVLGVDGAAGTQISSNTISAVGDASNITLVLSGKGSGGVSFGASTSAIGGMGRGIAVSPLVQLPVSGLVYSTITIPGVAVGDVLHVSRSTGMSTALAMGGAWVTGADEGSFAVLNNLASTQSVLAGATFPYVYFKA